ncbi:DNA replication regulator SLD3-domain-containing protein [Aspergillus egyptiacus]|nr:DNA replication regulator SLD3-domain-containing protein [Aspergillus egyptiacus]
MASREYLNALDPIPLNLVPHAQQPLKKRKRFSISDAPTTERIIIRAQAGSLSDEPYALDPIAVIPRLQLPFDWLDIPSELSPIQSGSLFTASIPALEAESLREPVVLVVRLSSDGGLYVIERVKKGIYALFKLARGVEEGDVRVVVKASSHRTNAGLWTGISRKQLDNVSEGDWWRLAQVEDPAPDLSVPIPAKRAKIDFVFGVSGDHVDPRERIKGISPMDSMDRSSSCDVRMVSVPPEVQTAVEPSVSQEIEGNAQEPAQSPQELLDGLREQYLQALYVSKASVAYFAKGPLARCRAAFQSPESTAGKVSDLVDFHRTAILAAKKMDLKYRETLPATIHDVILTISDDEAAPKRRKSKKKNLGRNGLYPEEQDYIRQWWRNRTLTETGTSIETSRDAEIKKHVSDLRLRETQLQILLILETMALDAIAADEANHTSGLEGSTEVTQVKPKAKKPQDLNVMLELHLDRICIWHAVSFDEAAVSESQASGSNQSGKAGGSDALRDFCTEVIIPFYASRLPDRCKLITRKLGVSASAASPFPKSTKKPSRKEAGASSLERNAPQKQSRRSLQRVLTGEQTTSHGRPQPSLNRSITAPSKIESKRETTPLLPSHSTSVRGGIQKAKRAENREVDLIAVARQHETKLKRVQLLAEQKKELDAAILALRKPNRELVAKDIAQDVEKRLTSSSSRKPKNPVRNPLGQGVQVMATPSKSRKRDPVVGLPPLPKSVARSTKEKPASFTSPFSSEPQVIPASVVRPSSFSATTSTAATAVQETPCRRPPQPVSLFNDTAEPTIAESPIPGSGNIFRVPRRPAPRPTDPNPLTPIRSQPGRLAAAGDSDVDMPLDITPQARLAPPPPPLFALPNKPAPSTHSSSMVFETPPKPPPVPISDSRKPSVAEPAKPAAVVPVTPEKSIYASLGWDDDDDLAL